MFEHLVDYRVTTENRVIKRPKFSSKLPPDIPLTDPIAIYNNGLTWTVIPIKVLQSYPIVHDNYYESIKTKDGKNVISPISITFCPFSGAAVSYFGTYTLYHKMSDCNIILKTKDNKLIRQIDGCIYDKTLRRAVPAEYVRKHEVRIMDFKTALVNYPDFQFLTNVPKTKTNEPFVPRNYMLTNELACSFPDKSYDIEKLLQLYHPKTYVYGIEYKSQNSVFSEEGQGQKEAKDYKYSVIVSKDSGPDKPNSLNLKENGINKYFDTVFNKIKEKGGVIIPVLWPIWIHYFPSSKIIKL